MQTFTTRPISNPTADWLKARLKRLGLRLARYLGIWAAVHVMLLFLLSLVLGRSQAQELNGLTFVDKFPSANILRNFQVTKPVAVAKAPGEKKTPIEGKKRNLLASACGNDEKCMCISNAIFTHDSSWATAGVGARANNPCNLRPPVTWKPSVKMSKIHSVNGTFAAFGSLKDGVIACVELYQRLYKDLPAQTLVKRWTNGGGNHAYRSAVSACYS